MNELEKKYKSWMKNFKDENGSQLRIGNIVSFSCGYIRKTGKLIGYTSDSRIKVKITEFRKQNKFALEYIFLIPSIAAKLEKETKIPIYINNKYGEEEPIEFTWEGK